jgi:thiosulfate dehydrogenase [quinone] large subunit
MAGLPVAHGWVVDDHLVYAALLFGLGAVGAGRVLGLDAYIERLAVVRNNRWLRYLLG